MKKTIAIIMLLGSVCAFAGSLPFGWGKVVTATTNETVLSIGPNSNDYASRVSIYNTGSETLYIMKNATTNQFAYTNAIPVPASSSYDLGSGGDVRSICYVTSTNSTVFSIAAE
jgi:hypothetical protein